MLAKVIVHNLRAFPGVYIVIGENLKKACPF